MAMQIVAATRIFKYRDITLPDPGNDLSPEEVMDFYATQYPDLTNGSVQGGEVDAEKDEVTYELAVNVGSKG